MQHYYEIFRSAGNRDYVYSAADLYVEPEAFVAFAETLTGKAAQRVQQLRVNQPCRPVPDLD
jgi:hypothetical protein